MEAEVSEINAPPPPPSDGDRWTGDPDALNGAAATPGSDGWQRIVVLGYILAVSMPPLGLILGITVAIRSRRTSSRHGLGIIVVSIIAALVWIPIIVSGALNTPNTDF